MKRPSRALLALAGAALPLAACAALPTAAADDEARVRAALDELHAAASAADGARYFALFAEGAVFYGTDASERWSVPEFEAYAAPYFAQGRGWTYAPTERHVFLAPGGETAWFDERLQNEKYGEVRGTGVLRKVEGRWLVAQYNLAFPVPNALAPDLVERVRALEGDEPQP
jgi:hypothetical protein